MIMVLNAILFPIYTWKNIIKISPNTRFQGRFRQIGGSAKQMGRVQILIYRQLFKY
jgi:hypothetical protein